ncbi:MAG: uncharacterized protein JWM34_2440 [Ilumatobacteraceae bacterium]|nr:uncharacterized protein [Ilumatobacteraceae bacterium]
MSAAAPSGAREVSAREKSLRQIELRVNRHLDGLLHGDHVSLMRGPGMDAGDARLYQPGDDARRIDWALTARKNETHVRDTVADRELEVWFVVDGTPSLDFGTALREKRDLALATVGALALIAVRNGNRIAAVCFDGDSSWVVPPRTGRDAAMAMMHTLQHRPRCERGAGSLAAALRRTRTLARRRGLVVVVTDLLDDGEWARELRALGSRHEVIVAEIRDPREDELPAVGLLTLVDPETGRRQEVQTNSARMRERFARAAAERRETARRSARGAGASHIVLSTDRDWLLDIVRFTTARRARR